MSTQTIQNWQLNPALRTYALTSMRQARTAKIVRRLSVANLVLVIALVVLLRVVSERWWLSTALTYLPRTPFVVPSLVLVFLSLRCCHRWTLVNLVTVVLAAGPFAGFVIPISGARAAIPIGASDSAESHSIRVVSCNVQRFEPDFATVLREIAGYRPDVIAFQEAPQQHPLTNAFFMEWHTVQSGAYCVLSKYPLRLVGICDSVSFDRTSAIKVEVDAPGGKFMLNNVHQMTARFSLMELNPGSIFTGEGQQKVERGLLMREEEARATRAFVSSDNAALPYLAVGDFNMPGSSSLFTENWGDLTNAFNQAGIGFGYTAPCREHRLWPSYLPWIRVDHILASDDWHVSSCETGTKNGSDHKLITASLVRRAKP